tara:strand:- start:4131 stop:5057 length:927 start_codon:yes stop_codon:yes gene_type:complete
MIKLWKKIERVFKKMSCWTKAVLIILILLICLKISGPIPKQEGFTQREKYVIKKNGDVYDDFYFEIYDDLVKNPVKNNYELKEILRITKTKGTALDIGSGTGHHVHLLTKKGIDAIGMDKSEAAIKKAKANYPDLEFIRGDASKPGEPVDGSFDLITCLFFSIYYMKDKSQFFKNCYQWLEPGGYLALHLVNREKFDPILPAADPLHLVSPQKYAQNRITNSLVKFRDFQYKADFKMFSDKNMAMFSETMTDDATGHVRQNEHIFYMPPQKRILSLAKQVGFKLLGNIDMVSCQYEYQYIYILQKPER